MGSLASSCPSPAGSDGNAVPALPYPGWKGRNSGIHWNVHVLPPASRSLGKVRPELGRVETRFRGREHEGLGASFGEGQGGEEVGP